MCFLSEASCTKGVRTVILPSASTEVEARGLSELAYLPGAKSQEERFKPWFPGPDPMSPHGAIFQFSALSLQISAASI